MNQQVVDIRSAIGNVAPESLTLDDRLALIELLRRCLTAGPESDAVASDGSAA